jgi:hypothetical protein
MVTQMPHPKNRRTRKTSSKRSQADVDVLADRTLKDLQRFAKEASSRKQEVTLLSRSDLVRKLLGQTSHSPFIVAISWFATAARGSTITASVVLFNPDPITYLAGNLFAHAFWGPANVLPDLDDYLLSADPAFPRFAVTLDAPPSPPISIATISIPLPTAVAAGTYLMNWLLFLRDPFGPGTFLERAGVFTTLT